MGRGKNQARLLSLPMLVSPLVKFERLPTPVSSPWGRRESQTGLSDFHFHFLSLPMLVSPPVKFEQ